MRWRRRLAALGVPLARFAVRVRVEPVGSLGSCSRATCASAWLAKSEQSRSWAASGADDVSGGTLVSSGGALVASALAVAEAEADVEGAGSGPEVTSPQSRPRRCLRDALWPRGRPLRGSSRLAPPRTRGSLGRWPMCRWSPRRARSRTRSAASPRGDRARSRRRGTRRRSSITSVSPTLQRSR